MSRWMRCTTCREYRWWCKKKNLSVEFEVRCLNLRKVAESHGPSTIFTHFRRLPYVAQLGDSSEMDL